MTPARSGKLVEAATGRQTRTALLERTKRSAVPLRRDFVQLSGRNETRSSVLATFVTSGNLRALRAYLMVVGASAAEDGREGKQGWYTELDSMVWARLFDTHEAATDASARTAAWRTLKQLEAKKLLEATRVKGSRWIGVTLKREDGSGDQYTRPGVADKDPYASIPRTFWTKGYDEQVGLPGLAMYLALIVERRWRRMTPEHMPDWYGWSADTTERGLKTLLELNMIERKERRVTAPLSPLGFTRYYEYRMRAAMRAKPPRQRPAATLAIEAAGK